MSQYIYQSTEGLPENYILTYKDITEKSSVIEIRDNGNMLENWEKEPIACLAGYCVILTPEDCNRLESHENKSEWHIQHCPPVEIESVVVFNSNTTTDKDYTGRGLGKRLLLEATKLADQKVRSMQLTVIPFRHKKRDESYLLNFYAFFGFTYSHRDNTGRPVMIREARGSNANAHAQNFPKGDNKVYEVRSNG